MKQSALDAAPRVTFPTPNLDWMISVLLQRKLLIFVAVVLAVAASVGVLAFLTPQYQVSAKILIKVGREHEPPPTASGIVGSTLISQENIASKIEILSVQKLIENVVRDVGVDLFYFEPEPETLFQKIKYVFKATFRAIRNGIKEVLIRIGLSQRLTKFEEVVLALQASLSAEPIRRTEVVQVFLMTPAPEIGEMLLQKLIEEYRKAHIEAYGSPHASKFFADRLAEFGTSIERLEERRREFVAENSVWREDEQMQLLLKEMQKVRDDMNESGAKIAHLREEIARIENAIEANGPLALSDASKGLKTDRWMKEIQLHSMNAAQDVRQQMLRDLGDRLNALTAASSTMREFSRELNTLEASYKLHAQRLEKARTFEAIDQAMISNISVIAGPTSSIRPVKPSKKLYLIAAFVLGFGGSIFVAFLLEVARPSLFHRGQVEDIIGAPLLGRLPQVRKGWEDA